MGKTVCNSKAYDEDKLKNLFKVMVLKTASQKQPRQHCSIKKVFLN